MPPKHKKTIYLTDEENKALEDWAASENRAVSNLAVTIIIKALEERQKQINSNSDRASDPSSETRS